MTKYLDYSGLKKVVNWVKGGFVSYNSESECFTQNNQDIQRVNINKIINDNNNTTTPKISLMVYDNQEDIATKDFRSFFSISSKTDKNGNSYAMFNSSIRDKNDKNIVYNLGTNSTPYNKLYSTKYDLSKKNTIVQQSIFSNEKYSLNKLNTDTGEKISYLENYIDKYDHVKQLFKYNISTSEYYYISNYLANDAIQGPSIECGYYKGSADGQFTRLNDQNLNFIQNVDGVLAKVFTISKDGITKKDGLSTECFTRDGNYYDLTQKLDTSASITETEINDLFK